MQDAITDTYRYHNCYQKEERLDSDPNISGKYGWATTQTVKWMLIREFQQALEHKEVILNDLMTVDELCQYVYKEDKNKTGAAEGLNDDCVIAVLLAFHAARLFPQAKKKTVEKPKGNPQHTGLMKRFMDDILSFGKKRKIM